MENLVISGEIVVEALKAAVAKHIKIEKGITITKDDVLDMIKEAILDNIDIQKAAKAFPVDNTGATEDDDEDEDFDLDDESEDEEDEEEPADDEEEDEDEEEPADDEGEPEPEPIAKPEPRKKAKAKEVKVAGKASKNVSGGMAVDVEAEEEAKNANDVRSAAKRLSKEISLKGIAVRQKLKKIVAKYSEDGSIGGIPDSLIGKYYAHIKKFADNLE